MARLEDILEAIKPFATLASLCFAAALACGAPSVIGRVEGGAVRSVVSGRFVTADLDDLLIATAEGTVRVAPLPGRAAQPVHLYRLALYRQSGPGLVRVWQSDPLLGTADSTLPGPWAAADLESDGRTELLIFHPESCLVVRFDALGQSSRAVPMPGAAVEAAAWCDLAGDGRYRLAALERGAVPGPLRLLRFWDWADSGFAPAAVEPLGFDWGDSVAIHLLGAARLEDYHGLLPVIAGIHRAVRPGLYGIAWSDSPGSVRFTAVPFPWRNWFSKTEVLPAGRLELFNVGDTLVAWGYFVPGARPSGPGRSFAALQDGAWRLLQLTEAAARIAGPACPFSWQGHAGWLEARDGLLHYYPDGIFRWR